MKKCLKCCAICADDDKHCSSCGFDMSENVINEESAGPAETPVKQKDKHSITCILGLICTGIYIFISAVYWIIKAFESYYETKIPVKWLFLMLGIVPLFLGLLLSVIGTVVAKGHKNKKAGRLGIWGSGGCLVLNIVLVLVLILCRFAENRRFENTDYQIGDYLIHYKTNDHSQAEAACYYWDGDPRNTDLKIDYCSDGTKIVRLDYFRIKPEDSKDYYTFKKYRDTFMGSLPDDRGYYKGLEPGTTLYFDNIIFNVEIGKDVEKVSISKNNSYIYPDDIAIWNGDGSVSFYRYFYYFTVDPENKNYYAEDGVLYNKKTGKKVEAFYKGQDMSYDTKASVYAPERAIETN